MSLADACLVRMTEIVADPLLLTTDTDFRLYRRHSRQVVPCMMPRVVRVARKKMPVPWPEERARRARVRRLGRCEIDRPATEHNLRRGADESCGCLPGANDGDRRRSVTSDYRYRFPALPATFTSSRSLHDAARDSPRTQKNARSLAGGTGSARSSAP